MVNIRQKGQQGERDVQKILNDIVISVRAEHNLSELDVRDLPFQRNQNQSAVGGDDLSNPFKLSIEVKRQEALSILGWWRQCVISAARTEGVPILIFKQSRKAWRVMMQGDIPLSAPGKSPYASLGPIPVEIHLDHFKTWFTEYYTMWLKGEGLVK